MSELPVVSSPELGPPTPDTIKKRSRKLLLAYYQKREPEAYSTYQHLYDSMVTGMLTQEQNDEGDKAVQDPGIFDWYTKYAICDLYAERLTGLSKEELAAVRGHVERAKLDLVQKRGVRDTGDCIMPGTGLPANSLMMFAIDLATMEPDPDIPSDIGDYLRAEAYATAMAKVDIFPDTGITYVL